MRVVLPASGCEMIANVRRHAIGGRQHLARMGEADPAEFGQDRRRAAATLEQGTADGGFQRLAGQAMTPHHATQVAAGIRQGQQEHLAGDEAVAALHGLVAAQNQIP